MSKKAAGAKKKGKKKGGRAVGAEPDLPPDQFDYMDSDQLKTAIADTTARLKEIKTQRISHQVERDQLQQFLDITHEQLLEKKGALELLESDIEQKQDTHQNDIRWYMSKVTHLELDHQTALASVDHENEENARAEQDRSRARRDTLRQQRAELLAKRSEDSAAQEQAIRNLLVLQQKEIRKLNQEFERQSKQLAQRYQDKLGQLRNDLELKRKMEIHEVEERKNLHINDLMRNHEKSFNSMRDYCNGITRDNLALISSLKDELAALKAKASVNERTIGEIELENKKLSEPLSQTESELRDLKSKLSNYLKEKRSLKLAKSRSSQFDAQLKTVQAQLDTLTISFKEVEADRDRLYAEFEGIVRQVQASGAERSLQLEQQVDKLIERFARKSNQFGEVLSAANIDDDTIASLTAKLDAVLDGKNVQVSQLEREIAKASKAHDDLIRAYNAKLPELGVPVKDIQLPFLMSSSSTTAVEPGSAVSAQ